MSLRKDLNLLDVFSITIGAVMSTGIFILPGLAYAKAGPGVLASYFLAGLLATVGLLNQKEAVFTSLITEALRDLILLGKRRRFAE